MAPVCPYQLCGWRSDFLKVHHPGCSGVINLYHFTSFKVWHTTTRKRKWKWWRLILQERFFFVDSLMIHVGCYTEYWKVSIFSCCCFRQDSDWWGTASWFSTLSLCGFAGHSLLQPSSPEIGFHSACLQLALTSRSIGYTCSQPCQVWHRRDTIIKSATHSKSHTTKSMKLFIVLWTPHPGSVT